MRQKVQKRHGCFRRLSLAQSRFPSFGRETSAKIRADIRIRRIQPQKPPLAADERRRRSDGLGHRGEAESAVFAERHRFFRVAVSDEFAEQTFPAAVNRGCATRNFAAFHHFAHKIPYALKSVHFLPPSETGAVEPRFKRRMGSMYLPVVSCMMLSYNIWKMRAPYALPL